jgi:hypothetical protein
VGRAVDAADAWAKAHLVILSASFESFKTEEEWASIEELQHSFEVKGQVLDVRQLSWQMPRPLGFVEQGRLILLCRALLQVPDASALLDDWFLVVKFAYQQWVDNQTFELTSEDVAKLLGGEVNRTRLVSHLLLREGWMFGSGSGVPEGNWTRELRSDVRVARHPRNARELLDARVAIEDAQPLAVVPLIDLDEGSVLPSAPPKQPTESTDTIAEPSNLRRRWDYATNNPFLATALAGICVIMLVALGGLLYAGGKKLVDFLGEDPEVTAAGGKFERAGEGGARTFPVAGVLAHEGRPVKPGQKVRVLCVVHAPTPPSAVPDGNWYKIGSDPWDGRYFAAANSFWNGDVPGQLPYTHNTDKSVEKCG